MLITKQLLENACDIIDCYAGTDKESLADDSVVSVMTNDYGLSVADGKSVLSEAHGIYAQIYC